MSSEPETRRLTLQCQKKGDKVPYRHIPCSAALDFSRTSMPVRVDAGRSCTRKRPAVFHPDNMSLSTNWSDGTDAKSGCKQVLENHRSSGASSKLLDRPDWTEQDECVAEESRFLKAIPHFMRKSDCMSMRSDALNEFEGVVEDGSIIIENFSNDNGQGWNCICLLPRTR